MKPLCLLPAFLLLAAPGALAAADAALEPVEDAAYWQEFREPFLPHPEPGTADVRAIALDGRGIVWLATAAGVRLLDGNAWRAPDGDPPPEQVIDLVCDAAGDVWLATSGGVFRRAENRWEQASGPAGPIARLAVTSAGLLAGGPDGVWLRRGDDWQKIEGRWGGAIRALAWVDDALWVGTSLGLYRHRAGTTERYFRPEQLATCDVRALAVAPDGRLWVGTGDGIDVFDDGRHVARYRDGDEAPPACEIRRLEFDAQGRLWAATTEGVIRREKEHWSLRHSLRWLPSDDARDLAVTPDGGAWIATAGGTARLSRRRMTLADKAAHYESIVRARHVRPPGLVEKCRLRVPGDLATHEPTDTDNDGMYTGMYLAAEAFRYAVTGSDEARRNAADAYRALEFLQTVTATPGFFARTVVPADWTDVADRNRTITPDEAALARLDDPRDKPVEVRWRKSGDGRWLWKGDTSSDETTGHFYAYAIYYDLVAEGPERVRVADHVRRIIDYIIDGGFVLRDIDGQATRWGVWAPARLNDDPNWRLDRGVNSVEILSYLAVAQHVTGDSKYRRAADELLEKHRYGRNVLDPQASDPGSFTHIDSQLLALAYPSLLKHEPDPRRLAVYRRSAEAWFAVNRRDASPFYNFVFASLGGGGFDLQAAVDYLRDVPLDMVQWTVDNSRRRDVRLVRRPVSDVWQVDRLLPPSERAILKWDSSPWRATAGEAGHTENSCTSWLVPYWHARYLGLILAPHDTEGPAADES